MKIAIIGAGISGLSTYLYLRKHLPATTSLTIYESYPFPSRTSARNTTSASFIGGGLGVAPNGMRALRALSSSLHASVMAQGVPVPRFVFKTAGGRILGVMPTIDPAGPGREEEAMVMSSRTGLWECLLEMVPAEAVVWGREVRGVNKVREGEMRIVFEDETVEDGWALVVGADGIWSKVRKELVGDGEAVKPEYQYGVLF
jgi:2-polyprenyl-6-methoxyphenol hydroxylase-like FAD-dependent oxidoreductase